MPSAVQKRKSRPETHISKGATSNQHGIRAFGKVRKPQLKEIGKNNLKRKHIEEILVADNGPHLIEIERVKEPRIGLSGNPLGLPKAVQKKAEEKPVVNSARKRKASEEPAVTPPPEETWTATKDAKRKRTTLRPHPLTDTPTRGARSLLERFAFGASSSPAREVSPSPIKQETPPSSPPSLVDADSQDLPEELLDLINLHSSFLTALSLYYAHNGLSNPADLRNLYPGMERTWKKRRVNADDVRRILAIGQDENAETNVLYLSDYGHNKICVEVSDHALQAQRRVIDEEALNAAFTRSLSGKWSSFRKTPTIGNPSPTAFLSHLPLLPITASTSLADLKPLLAKGQHRLSDLKAGAIAAQSRNSLPSPKADATANALSSDKGIAVPTKTRATNLLDRLAAKAQQQSTLPAPPTPSQLARKRALQRLPDIAPVLQSLAVGAQKHDNGDTAEYADGAAARERRPLVQRQVSFTMATLVQVLQGSLRNPIARDEAVACVMLMAEVVPEWVTVREVGRCVGVVVRGGGVGRGELEGRVKGLLGEN